jgi:ABC-2 type transport system ATP-binding protein
MNQDIESRVALSLRNLHKTFPKGFWGRRQAAVKDLTCEFPRGQCTGLLGHNGAGKTTVMRLILGLMRPDRGEILFLDHALSLSDKSLIGYMPEIDKLSLNLTPVETLRFHLQLFGHRGALRGLSHKPLIEEALKTIGLWEHRHKKVGTLSKGMRRRLAWAQATIHKPELVILDEPFSGLDPMGRKQMEGWIRDLKRDGVSLILCTHEIWTMRALCDHFHILRQGSLVYSSRNPVEGQEGAQAASTGFVLRLSGADEASLTALARADHLPPWGRLKQQGLLAILEFSEYADASRWVKAAVDRGLVIAAFGDAEAGPMGDEDRFIQMFRGGDVC